MDSSKLIDSPYEEQRDAIVQWRALSRISMPYIVGQRNFCCPTCVLTSMPIEILFSS